MREARIRPTGLAGTARHDCARPHRHHGDQLIEACGSLPGLRAGGVDGRHQGRQPHHAPLGVAEGLAVNAQASEFCTLSLVDPTGAGEVVRWPDRLLSVVSGADLTQRAWNLARWQCETWSPITTQGVEGRWANVRLALGCKPMGS